MNKKSKALQSLVVLVTLGFGFVYAAGLGELFNGKSPTKTGSTKGPATSNPIPGAQAKPPTTLKSAPNQNSPVKPQAEDQNSKK
ncbi:hypothetical protein AOC06_08580 [Polynucleobacter paludilacus]|uniref:hypothetical protein n=1 Tax=Polynucleobacter paludilacus TaxID=1855895 RepID=UPI001BFCECA5|nr:hypothetical protein [Polynucleobacter paludilacus]QWD86982.1 hypothetical protein AOC06_08580 [Polynucleobacter paludilacus]